MPDFYLGCVWLEEGNGGEGRDYFKLKLFGSIINRGGEGSNIPPKANFSSPSKIWGIWRESIFLFHLDLNVHIIPSSSQTQFFYNPSHPLPSIPLNQFFAENY